MLVVGRDDDQELVEQRPVVGRPIGPDGTGHALVRILLPRSPRH